MRLAVVAILVSAAACGDDADTADGGEAPEAAATSTTPVTTDASDAAQSAETPAASAPESSRSTLLTTTTTAMTKPTLPVQTPEELLAELTDDQIAGLGGPECALEAATITSAARQFINDRGVEPETIDELFEAGYLTEPLQFWDVVGVSLHPKPGSGCIDPQASSICVEDAVAIAIGRLAFLQARVDATEPTQAELVLAGLIDQPNPGLELIGGEVTAVPGGACDGIDLTVDWQRECARAAATLEVAYQAYYARNGTAPSSEAELVTAGMIRWESAIVDLDGADAVATTGGPCEGLDLG